MKKLLSFLLFIITYSAQSQNGVGIGTSTPNANAALEIKSTNKGLLMPRISTAARKNMSSVAKGMIVFDSTYNSFYYNDGSRWLPISDNNVDSLLTDYSSVPQTIANMEAGSSVITTAMSGLLYDNGGPSGNYGNNRIDTYQIEKDNSDDSTIAYKVIVESLNLESPYDTLEIYTFGDYSRKLLFTGNRIGTFYFINNGEPLIFAFTSNAVNNAAGFSIRWSKLSTNTAATTQPPMYGWYYNQRKIAVRGGVNISNSWATDSLGLHSFCFGINSKATGEGAVAFGNENIATGNYSFIAGQNNKAEAPFSIALGYGSIAKGGRGNNVAIGFNAFALQENSLALGFTARAGEHDALAIGSYSTANAPGSTSIGIRSLSTGNSSQAFGSSVSAIADFSTAIGTGSRAEGMASTAVGAQVKSIGNFSFAAGDQAEARVNNSIAIGTKAIANGSYATSIGNNTMATGFSATAMGQNSTASGAAAFAAGHFTNASGNSSTALGSGSAATGHLSFAIGESSTAAGTNSVAIGTINNASGPGSLALGALNYSGGNRSVAIGTTLIVNGEYATALGTKMTIPSTAPGSLAIGDLEFSSNAIDNTSVGNPNEFVARFRGGYFFMTSANAPGGLYSGRSGVKMGPGQNSWSAISDVRLKENFEPVDGEGILRKIATMKSVTWNYKQQDPKTFRHYGPMAQEFFEAFGKDKYGSIGCDSLINQQDFLGVSFVAIQALEKRSTASQQEIAVLKEQLQLLKENNAMLLLKLEALDLKNKKK